jgi:hypothetical protein
MLSRLVSWLRSIGSEPPPPPSATIDPLAMDVARRQRRVARRLAAYTDRTPEELLDYRRADGILGGGR